MPILSGLKRLRSKHQAQETGTASLRRAQLRRKHQDRYEQKQVLTASVVGEHKGFALQSQGRSFF